MDDQRVCRLHGGKAPRSLAAAERRRQEAEAAAAARTFGLAVDISPTDALLEEVRWTAGHVQWLRARVQELDGDGLDGERHPLVWGRAKTAEKDGALGAEVTTTDEGRPSIWYELYARERDHLVKVCQAALKAGVEERRVRLAEQQGELVAGAIRAILADLGLSAEQEALVAEVVPRHLRVLAGGAA